MWQISIILVLILVPKFLSTLKSFKFVSCDVTNSNHRNSHFSMHMRENITMLQSGNFA